MRYKLILLCPWLLVTYCEHGGPRYQSGDDGFSEFLPFEGLRSLRLQLDNPPQQMYLAEGFSKLTALTSLELVRSFSASCYKPIFSASAFSQAPAGARQQIPS